MLTAYGSVQHAVRAMKSGAAQYLRQLLARYDGHRAKVAGILGISVRNTYRLIRKYGL